MPVNAKDGSGSAKIRVVAFVPQSVVDQYKKLSKQYGISRSELYRLALQRGFKSIAAWVEKTHELFSETESEADSGSAEGSVVEKSGAGSEKSDPEVDRVLMLSDFTKVLVEQDPDMPIDQVRSMMKAQATVFGVPESEVDEVVARVMAQIFPAELDGSGEGEGPVGIVDLD